MNKSSNIYQKGFVSIIVASMIMVILALITIGFTRIMQREQRQVLDRQLSRQALYAAESGINDVYARVVADHPIAPFDANEKTDCNATGLDQQLDGPGGDIVYTCALYDQSPSVLEYEISSTNSEITKLESSTGNFTQITISWSNATDGSTNNIDANVCSGKFPAALGSDFIPVLKVDLTNTSSYARSHLIDKTDYLYLAPCDNVSGTSNFTYNTTAKGTVVPVRCSSGSECSLTISGLDLDPGNPDSYLARIRPIYSTAKVSITGVDGGPVDFIGAQISIDVTAKANDVVRRLRATVPVALSEDAPEAVFHAFDGVCKLLSVDRINSVVEDTCSYR